MGGSFTQIALQDFSPWVILMSFSTTDSTSPGLSSTRLSLAPQKTIPPHSTGPLGLIEKMCVLGRWEKGGCYWRLLFTRNENGSEPQWEGRQRCRIFLNEITPCTAPPCAPRILNAGPWLVEPPSHWRQTDSLVDESARKSIHSASHKRRGWIEEEEMQATPGETLAQLGWGRGSAHIPRDCLYYLNERPIASITWLGFYKNTAPAKESRKSSR